MPDSAPLRSVLASCLVAVQMPSLRYLLAAHSPLLMVDAASSCVQVGWFPSTDPANAKWATSNEESGTGIFRGLEQLDLELGAARAFVFCDGPGSVLGIRTTAIAIRVWNVLASRPVFSFCSLAVVAHALGRAEVGVIADARRESWHHFQIGGTLRRVPVAELGGELVLPENFRYWSQLPAGLTHAPYNLASTLPSLVDADLFHTSASPDAFLYEEPNYATWTPRIHRAPVR